MAMSPSTAGPLGRYSAAAATIIAVLFVLAAVGVHVWADTHPGVTPDAWLDTTALVVVGVVLGVGAIGGTASTALDTARNAASLATAAHTRLDSVSAPPSAGSGVDQFDPPGVPLS